MNEIIRAQVDTNSNAIRNKRGERQYTFEKNLSKLYGTSIMERFFTIRDYLYEGWLSLNGWKLDMLITDGQAPNYPDRYSVATYYLPTFYRLIDDIYEKNLINISNYEEKQNSGFRLSVITYVINILIHQSADGNGQTSKLMSLSYIHEFVPELRNNFFPIKYEVSSSNNPLYNPYDDIFSWFEKFDVESTLPPVIQNSDKKIFNIMKLISDLDIQAKQYSYLKKLVLVDHKAFQERMRAEYFSLAKKIEEISDISILAEMLQHKDDYIMCSAKAKEIILGYLNYKYQGYHFSESGDEKPSRDSVHRKKFILTMLLMEEEGLNLLRSYIIFGTKRTKEKIKKFNNQKKANFYESALNVFITYEQDFRRVLLAENINKHKKKYQNFQQSRLNNPRI